MRATPARGFTLIEVMIVVAVVALLSSLAYPTYVAHVARGRRADAKQALLELAQRMERFYTERGTYVGATLGSTGLYPTVSTGGYYTLAITTQTADGFTITAAPRGAQTGDACATFGYNQVGDQSVSSDASLPAAKCW
jgi:type IV pilus assembly protein PilE